MANMQMIIVVQTEEDPSPQSYIGSEVTAAQAFMAGLSGTFQSVQCNMSCMTPMGEAHLMQRSAVNVLCEPTMVDIDAWLVENAAYE
jgi:hypothetical protein